MAGFLCTLQACIRIHHFKLMPIQINSRSNLDMHYPTQIRADFDPAHLPAPHEHQVLGQKVAESPAQLQVTQVT